jgi:UDP-N-acetylmuramyl pentapeptide synthase
MIRGIAISTLLLTALAASASELVHNFQSPSFIPGNGFSQHVLTIHQLEAQRKQKLKDEENAALAKEELAKRNTNLAKFLVNVESRIYAQLSKQLADAMFTNGGATEGDLDFQGTNIHWSKSETEVTLIVIDVNGSRTEITVPIASFAF